MATARAAHFQPDANNLTVEDLAGLTVRELEALYRTAALPASLTALDGAPPGRMLAVRGLDGAVARRMVASLAAHPRFPWNGKSFASLSATAGTGINRTTLLGDRYPFETKIAPSAIDGKPAVFLEYALPANPFFIRAIWDEVREVSPGLFFGPAMVKRRRRDPLLVLYFACDNSGR